MRIDRNKSICTEIVRLTMVNTEISMVVTPIVQTLSTSDVILPKAVVTALLTINDKRTVKGVCAKVLQNMGVEWNNMVPYVIDNIAATAKEITKHKIKNPYLNNVKLPEVMNNGTGLEYDKFDKGYIIVYDEANGYGYYDKVRRIYDIPKLCMFSEDYEYTKLMIDGRCWMSITPNEIHTMAKAVLEANGKVLTLGLGMGYYAYMAALKENVSSVTVIENDTRIIKIYEQYIKPAFGAVADKIEVIYDDAIKYVNNISDGSYDYCFADIWQNSADLVPYINALVALSRFKMMKCRLWIDNSFGANMLQQMLAIIELEFFGDDVLGIPREVLDAIYGGVPYKLLSATFKDYEIKTKSNIEYLLDWPTLKREVVCEVLRNEELRAILK